MVETTQEERYEALRFRYPRMPESLKQIFIEEKVLHKFNFFYKRSEWKILASLLLDFSASVPIVNQKAFEYMQTMATDFEIGDLHGGYKKQILRGLDIVPDFPIKGVDFYDISRFLNNRLEFIVMFNLLKDSIDTEIPKDTYIFGIESRGLIYAPLLADKLNACFNMVRKPNKLPHPDVSIKYKTEYSEDVLEFNLPKNMTPESKIIIHDDVLATGGTALAVANELWKRDIPSENIYFSFMFTIKPLNGIDKLRQNGFLANNIFTVFNF